MKNITRIVYELPAGYNRGSFTQDMEAGETMPCMVGDTVYVEKTDGRGSGQIKSRHHTLTGSWGAGSCLTIITVKLDDWEVRKPG